MCNPGLLCSIGEAINAWIKDLNWIYAKFLNRNCRKDRCADKIAESISARCFLYFYTAKHLIRRNQAEFSMIWSGLEQYQPRKKEYF